MSFFSKQIDKRIAVYQRELIETHYREVENMYRQMRGWRHDYRNHIQTMKILAANDDLQGLKQYLDELDHDLNTLDLVVKTGNAMADAILNSKISLARAKDINVHVDAHIPVKLKMSEIDLCCIIGNLFDNAIEASLALPEEERMIRLGPIFMDDEKRAVFVDDQQCELTYKEYELLKLLLLNAGIVASRDMILDRVWGTDFEGESRTLDMHIKTLRQKLGSAGPMIRTVRNVGYMLTGEDI